MFSFLRREDTWLKLFSLLVALAVWVYVASRGTGPAEVGWRVNVPLEVRGLASGLVAGGLPGAIEVAVVAAPGDEAQVKKQLRAVLPLEGLGAGHHRVAVRVPAPQTGRVVGVSPRWVEVDLEAFGERTAAVQVEVSGTPAAGLVAGPPQAAPGEVRLKGLASRLAAVAGVRASVTVEGAGGEVRLAVPVTPVDAAGRTVAGVTCEPAEVEVTVPVGPQAPAGGQQER